ncbi:MAG TPA: peptidoglycan DD-metalloendopeptidase family protein [Candidatus Dormibacteraeota bacterium]|nr:peptidoglycan DD-metalloendopeptidase family protein [Candidatus Dormibacteraeota bacterium]
MRIYRYAGHGAVLLITLAMWSYGATDLNASLASNPLTAQAANQGEMDGMEVGQDSTIITPVSIPVAPLPNRKPIPYVVKTDDTLQSIAKKFEVTLREITWSNPGLRQPLKVGKVLWLPPVPGVVVTVRKGDTPASLATAYGVDESTVLGFNRIRAADLLPGLVIVIPIDPLVGPNLSSGLPADPIQPEAFMCPIKGAKIIQGFGPTGFALEPSYAGYLHFHTGVDILAEYGTPILAASGGRVTATGVADYFGIRVEVTDSYGLVEIYAHMQDESVALGQSIQQGQVLGTVGSTGLSIGAHLHFQLEVGGVPTDPLPLVGCQ